MCANDGNPLAKIVRYHRKNEAARFRREHPLAHAGRKLALPEGADGVIEVDDDPAQAPVPKGVERYVGDPKRLMIGPKHRWAFCGTISTLSSISYTARSLRSQAIHRG